MALNDPFGRTIDYLRIAVTDRCNLRCIYCMPRGVPSCAAPDTLIKKEALESLLRVAVKYGLRKVRFTGGEPLLRGDIAELVYSAKRLGVADVSLTTNGLFLKDRARELKAAGLDRVNVSLDSLRPGRYSELTGGGSVERAYEGIMCAEAEGFSPIKINVVPLRGINDDEMASFAALTLVKPYHVRFIELMPMGEGGWDGERRVASADVMEAISARLGRLLHVGAEGSSRNFRLAGSKGALGFISPMSKHFCGTCNRLRLTTRQTLRPCLFSSEEVSIAGAASDEEMEAVLRRAVGRKPRGKEGVSSLPLEAMSQVGG
jgi:cyclic pyranopterin phosphate synthase